MAVGLARLAEQVDPLGARRSNGKVFQKAPSQRDRVLGAEFLDAIALIQPQRRVRVAEPGHRQRLQIAGL